MIAQILLSLIANFAVLVFVVNCGGKKKGGPAGSAKSAPAGGAGAGDAGGSNESKKTPSKMDKPAAGGASDKKDGDDGNYEELAVPS
ncbi:hypothetical protein GCK72_020401 [Caenorhabditis remanei]|uniref:Uncharacterized protein n=1 Tax=Caenorhabditis remanei TaxID=31234 RepID=E3LIN6_CAERE|nr:hypothetical protein GCK72_020401 [Caenorhabditis remanei]EFO94890.1 hypothetical protein CRE_09402 [Caenorhabditis remanei]KAF1753844.1 hypothetical protein GCK72_020401 [Caenorhabditis remanei]